MSVQRANRSAICSAIRSSALPMPPRVSSEKTTPKPNVSAAALRSQTVTSWRRVELLHQGGEVEPAGPAADDRDLHDCPSWEQAVLPRRLEVLQLAAGVARQDVDEADVARVLVGGDPAP